MKSRRKNGRDSQSRETEVGEKIAVINYLHVMYDQQFFLFQKQNNSLKRIQIGENSDFHNVLLDDQNDTYTFLPQNQH